MKVIRANSRVQFSAEDIGFIVSVLGSKVQSTDTLTQLLADEETRDLILDDESLIRAVLEHPSCLRISTHFYFYLLVRHVFRRSGLNDRGVADYVLSWEMPHDSPYRSILRSDYRRVYIGNRLELFERRAAKLSSGEGQ